MHVSEVLQLLRRRLRKLELLQAQNGIATEAGIFLEIENIQCWIDILEQAADEDYDIPDGINEVIEDVRDLLDIEYIAFN